MNKNYRDKILLLCGTQKIKNQRELSNKLKISVGKINYILKELKDEGIINEKFEINETYLKKISINKPKSAIILAAGIGSRMAPINLNVPKALIEINSEVLIERIIKFLHEVNIKKIYIVVGFQKEKFEYLIDKYDVDLIVNSKYQEFNNIYSLYLLRDKIDCSYVVPANIWLSNNPFNLNELSSWILMSNKKDENSNWFVRKNGKIEIKKTKFGNRKIGIAYIDSLDSKKIKKQIVDKIEKFKCYENYWEDILVENDEIMIKGIIKNDKDFYEIDTYEHLRILDENSNSLKNDSIELIKDVFCVESNEIKGIRALKKGMTNRSFLFGIKDKKYIMRIPGEGTENLINRKQEAQVYKEIKKYGICDNIIYINELNGYKITEYIENTRTCDINNNEDLELCMKFLKKFHNLDIKVNHEFNIFSQIDLYEKLWGGKKPDYLDYYETKQKVFSLKKYIDDHIERRSLTHIDAVPDNFLIYNNENNIKEVKLIDFEYSGMQDPHVDIAMFCIYSLYNKKQIDKLIDIYFENNCTKENRIKIYCYISCCGLLWSNWCEYKKMLGVEFGEYSLRQYRYAKEYYLIALEEMENDQYE